jgi:hypothetical protein
MRKPSQEVCTAFHEAGHALAAHVHNIPIRSVTIAPTDEFIGKVYFARADPEDALTILLAGESAERNLLGIKWVTGVGSDFEAATKAYAELRKQARFAKRRVPTATEINDRVDRLILKHRAAIESLAGTLLVCGTLDGLTVHHILQHAIEPGQPIAKRAKRKPMTRNFAKLSTLGTASLFEPRPTGRFAKLHTSTDLWKYRPDQARDEQGQFADEGKGGAGGGWGRTALTVGTAVLAVGAAAVAVRTGNAAALQGLARQAARQAGFGGTTVAGGGRTVSRSALESSIYNVSGLYSTLGLRPLRNELAGRFKGMDARVVFGTDSEGVRGIGILIRNKRSTVTPRHIATGTVPTDQFVAEMMVHQSESLGKALKVANLYSPDTPKGHMFTRRAFDAIFKTAVANKVDNIHTFAGSSMGGFYWPQMGFKLGGVNGTTGKALRSLISKRAGELLDAGAINQATYKELATIVGKQWNKDTPTRLAHMNAKINLGSTKLTDFPGPHLLRGEMTLGKALLAGTQGFYVLPKAKYESLMTITKRAPLAARLRSAAAG